MHLPVLFFLLLCRVEVMLSDEDFRESDPEDRELFVENVLKEVGGRRYCGFTSLRLPKLHISIREKEWREPTTYGIASFLQWVC